MHSTAHPGEDAAFLAQLLDKLGTSASTLLSVARERVLADHQARARDLWSLLALSGENEAATVAARVGDSVSAHSVGTLLRLKKSGVHKAKTEGRILAFRLPGDQSDLFPLVQIGGGAIRPWVPKLIAHVGNGLSAVHFLGVARKSLGGASYFELIREADDAEVIDAMIAHAGGIGNPASLPLGSRRLPVAV